MRRILLLLPILVLSISARLVAGPADPAPVDSARVSGIGGLVFLSTSPDSLAAWYADKFGLATPMKQDGAHYGMIASADGPIHFGIMPFPPGMPARAGGAVGIVFRVNDFNAYIARLKQRGLTPNSEMADGDGRFASFVDPDGNAVTIWGR